MAGPLDAPVVCNSDTHCGTTVPWRVGAGMTEVMVFGIGLDGAATPVGDKAVFTYR